MFHADVPEVDIRYPVKAGQTIYAGAVLELNGGYLENASAAGTFGGFALEDSVAVLGESDGDRLVKVRVLGAVHLDITTETPAQSDVGLSTSVVKATDNDTFRIERNGSPVTGVTIGKVVRIVEPGRVAVSFRAQMVA
ncbi:MAG: hypothetical protein JNL08_05810 [Planctomycetes bacterium]|nr:hypothetical protein [Planctomycetota bacterium]